MTPTALPLLAAGLAAVLAGCGVISKEIRQEAVPYGDFAELRLHPGEYTGETVILGGEIVETRNRPEGTTLVVLEKPLGFGDRPEGGDVSGGRFLVRFPEYLDPFVYATGRRVTVAGTVTGTVTERVGETSVTHLVLEGREIHLWREPEYLGPHPPWFYPYEPWYPYWYDPYWGRRPWW